MTEPQARPLPHDAELRRLVDDYRTRRLWFLRPDLYPETPEQALRILRHLERHGDRDGRRVVAFGR